MTYFNDMAPNTYFGRWADVLVSVGWLDAEHAYKRGPVTTEVYRALVSHLVEPWQPATFAGRAMCAMCRFSGGPGTITFERTKIVLASNNLFIPSKGRVFVSPSLVAHFVDAHEYCPPEEFQQAIVDCPPMGSAAYLRALRECGLEV